MFELGYDRLIGSIRHAGGFAPGHLTEGFFVVDHRERPFTILGRGDSGDFLVARNEAVACHLAASSFSLASSSPLYLERLADHPRAPAGFPPYRGRAGT